MSENIEGSDEKQLESWKEIAAYLKRDVRTVIRWEKSEGLPVHRHLHQARSSVYAYPSEIDAWSATRKPRREEARAMRRSVPALAFAAVLMLSLLLVADAPFSAHVVAADQDREALVERRVLSQHETDLNNFFFLRPSPDGRSVAYSAIGTREGALYLRELKSGQTRKLTTGEFTGSPVWSPDGTRIAYALTSAANVAPALKVLDIKSGSSSVLVQIESTEVTPLDWSPDGTRLLCTITRPDHTSTLALVSLSKGGLVPLLSQGWNANSSASFSPDGRYIALSAVDGGNRDIYVLAVDGSRKQRVTDAPEADASPLWSPTGDVIVYQRDDGVWAIHIAEGRPQGPPRLVRSKRFDQPVSWTAAGGLSYVMYNYLSADYTLSVDPQSGKATGPAQRLEIALDQVDRFAWSLDMKWAAISRTGDGKIYLYSATDRSLRSFATGVEQNPSALWWSGDGKAILFVPYQGNNVLSLNPLDGNVRPLFPRITESERFDVSRDGTTMLFYKGARSGGQRQLVVSKVGELEGRVLVSEQDPAGGFSNWVRPAFSLDGSKVLFARAGKSEDSLWVLGTDGASPRKLASVKRDLPASLEAANDVPFLHYAVWSPDGRHIAYDNFKSVFVVDVATAQQQQIDLPQEFSELGVMQWSPDGTRIGLRSRTSDFELWEADNLLPETTAGR